MPGRSGWFAFIPSIAFIVFLGACTPVALESKHASIEAGAATTSLQVQTYGDGGNGILGGALSIHAGMAQTVEVIYSVVVPPDENGASNRQELMLRYSQEPVPPEN